MRTLDLIHVAAALLLGANVRLSFDNRQRKVAAREGITALP
jgi:predicted nucleic acid-binding protein